MCGCVIILRSARYTSENQSTYSLFDICASIRIRLCAAMGSANKWFVFFWILFIVKGQLINVMGSRSSSASLFFIITNSVNKLHIGRFILSICNAINRIGHLNICVQIINLLTFGLFIWLRPFLFFIVYRINFMMAIFSEGKK